VTDNGADFVLWRERSAAAPFTVCAFFTASHRVLAERLAASLEALDLPHAIFETPAVHHSVSPRGGSDLRFSKPRFIAACLAALDRPVLYVDCDVVFRARPVAVEQAEQGGADFAIFNWLAAPATDAWVPVPGQAAPRFWRFAFTLSEQSFDQLATSGAVQFWRTTPATDVLLREWEAALARFDGAPDDQALDFAFNRGGAFAAGINPVWLPADHVRIAFWPYVKPVIDHPGFPTASRDFFGVETRFDRSRLKVKPRPPVLPRDLIVDAQQGLLLRPLPQGELEPAGPLPVPLFLDDVP